MIKTSKTELYFVKLVIIIISIAVSVNQGKSQEIRILKNATHIDSFIFPLVSHEHVDTVVVLSQFKRIFGSQYNKIKTPNNSLVLLYKKFGIRLFTGNLDMYTLQEHKLLRHKVPIDRLEILSVSIDFKLNDDVVVSIDSFNIKKNTTYKEIINSYLANFILWENSIANRWLLINFKNRIISLEFEDSNECNCISLLKFDL